MRKIILYILVISVVLNSYTGENKSLGKSKLKELNLHNATHIIGCDGHNLLYTVNIPTYRLLALNLDSLKLTEIGDISPSESYNKSIFYKDSVILYDQLSCTLYSFNLYRNQFDWSNEIIKDESRKFGNEMLPAVFEDILFFSTNQGILKIRLNDGKIIEPIDKDIQNSIVNCNGFNYVFGNQIISNNSMNVYAYDRYTKQLLWRVGYIDGKEECKPNSIINNDIIKYENSYYIQYNGVGCSNCVSSFLAEVDSKNGNLTNMYNTTLSSGIWTDANYAYIFPSINGDYKLLRFDLDNKSIKVIYLPDYYRPLGVYKTYLYYQTIDSVIKSDLDGKIIDQLKLGKMTYDNCRLYGDKIYYIDGEKLKIIDLESEKTPTPPFNFIKWILDFILRKIIGQP